MKKPNDLPPGQSIENQPWRLRPAQLADAAPLSQSCMPNRTVAEICDLLNQPPNRRQQIIGMVAETTNGLLIGFGRLTLWTRIAEISDMVVAPDWRNHGIGSAMIKRFLTIARQNGLPKAEIGVALSNTRALALYRRLGFFDGRVIEMDLGQGVEPVLYLTATLPQQ